MPSKTRKHVLVNQSLVPRLEQKMELSGKKFNTVGNAYIEKGLDSEEKDLTPSMVKKVLPGFETSTLLSLVVECVGIISNRASGGKGSEDLAIAAWQKLVEEGELDIPTLSRLAKATNTSVIALQGALANKEEKEEDARI